MAADCANLRKLLPQQLDLRRAIRLGDCRASFPLAGTSNRISRFVATTLGDLNAVAPHRNQSRSASPDETSAEIPADLVYSSDAEPGIRRRRAGRGFWYTDTDGRKIVGSSVLQRIRSLAIPPAWTDVWIAPRKNGHIQAIGRDARGRKQYRYHPHWTLCRDEVKYASLVDFARALAKLRHRVQLDLAKRGLVRDRVLAAVVWLLDNAMIRIGNSAYAHDNKSFGLTTLRDRHVKIDGATLRFSFRGKSGKDWRLKITDRRIARIVKGVQDLPGQHLFQYMDDEGVRRSVTSRDVNDYIRDRSDCAFTSKHFRTWGGTVRAGLLLAATDRPDSKGKLARVLNGVIDQVASRLGNTRTVCRNCYVHPLVVSAWTHGRLGDEMLKIGRRYRRPPNGLDREEAVMLRWLEQAQSSTVSQLAAR